MVIPLCRTRPHHVVLFSSQNILPTFSSGRQGTYEGLVLINVYTCVWDGLWGENFREEKSREKRDDA
jgi:hypothetical protein